MAKVDKPNLSVDVVIAGGGMLGAFTAARLPELGKNLSVVCLRLKDDPFPRAESLRNQGLLQSGLRYDAAMLAAVIAAFEGSANSSASIQDIADRFNGSTADELGRAMSNKWVGSFVRRLGLATMKTGGVYVVPATELPKARLLAQRFGVQEAA